MDLLSQLNVPIKTTHYKSNTRDYSEQNNNNQFNRTFDLAGMR